MVGENNDWEEEGENEGYLALDRGEGGENSVVVKEEGETEGGYFRGVGQGK